MALSAIIGFAIIILIVVGFVVSFWLMPKKIDRQDEYRD